MSNPFKPITVPVVTDPAKMARVAPAMTITPQGIAVLPASMDSWLSRWVERDGSLDAYDPRIRDIFCRLIPVGGVVVDGGAFIGDHTVAYAQRVGESGAVWAFEPSPDALPCLRRNVDAYPQVRVESVALSDRMGDAMLLRYLINPGASHLHRDGDTPIACVTLDSYALPRLDFLKLDIEGYELRALNGAIDTLSRCRPVVLVESGTHSLRYNDKHEDLMNFMAHQGYTMHTLPQLCEDVVFDVLFKPDLRP